MAAINKANREKQGFPHRIGRKGLSDIRHEMEEDGESTDRMSVWLMSRKPKPDVRQDPDTEEVISQFNDRLAQFPEVEQTSEVREEIFREVLGSDGHGRVRTYGRGPSYTDVFSGKSKTPVEQRIEKMSEELAATKKQVEMQQAMFDGMRAYFEAQGIKMPFFNEQVPDVGSSHRPHPQPSSHHGSASHD